MMKQTLFDRECVMRCRPVRFRPELESLEERRVLSAPQLFDVAAAPLPVVHGDRVDALVPSGLTRVQKRRAEAITSILENDTPKLQYAYAEALDDGRGITPGRAGFTTG